MALMRQAVLYTGCEVLTYAVLDNHMHTLVFVPGDSPAALSDEVFLKRVGALYGKEEVAYLRGLLAACEHDEVVVRERALALYEGERARHERRMHDVSAFVKIVKQRFLRLIGIRAGIPLGGSGRTGLRVCSLKTHRKRCGRWRLIST